MARYTIKRKEDIGLSPQEIVFRGRKKSNSIYINQWEYNKSSVQEKEITQVSDIIVSDNSSDYLWIDVVGLHQVETITEIGNKFDIPSNILSDILDPNIRPKAEDFDKGVFFSLKILYYNSHSKKLTCDNLSLIVLNNILISFQEKENDIFHIVKERLKKTGSKNKIRTAGSDYLAFSLIDIVIDNYVYIMSVMGDKIEDLEESVYGKDVKKDILNLTNFYKRELNYFRRQVKPAKEMIMNLTKLNSACIHDENDRYFRELQDNVKEASDLSDSYREILYDLLNIYHATLSSKLNDVMKLLTIFSVIFIPITFIVGVYGTNFVYFPELSWKYGYFIMWGIIVLITIGMLIYFKHKKWF